jgi:hypothetical protein
MKHLKNAPKTHLKTIATIHNIRIKHIQHMCETYAICVWKTQMKHTSKTSETLENILLQHVSETTATYATCAISPIYFCNIHVKEMQHTSKTPETN